MSFLRLELLFLFFLPGFAFTFLIVWRRSRGKLNFLKITLWASLVGVAGAAVILGSLNAAVMYWMRDHEVDHFTAPLTVEQARQQDCPIPLPDSAQNVQFVTTSGGLQALEILVRFEAPVDVCKGHVQTAFDAWSKQMGRSLHALPLTTLNQTPPPEDKDMVGRAAWFDVEKINHGLEAGNTPESMSDAPQFWVDEDRGVFYCKISD